MKVKRSLNEIEHTCRKAARGCGLPWGVADEVGKAVRWLHVFGLDGVSLIVSLLQQVDHREPLMVAPQSLDGTWRGPQDLLSPLLVGPSLCDCMQIMPDTGIQTGAIAFPLLTVGFLGQAALSRGLAVRVEWQDVSLDLYRDHLSISGNQDCLACARAETLCCKRLALSEEAQSMPLVIGDAEVDATAWDCLEKYAHQTYVEASEASRLSGAGAGLNDND
jgi:hypothetical protein